MAGFKYNLLSVEKDFEGNEWKVYDEGSENHLKPVLKLDGSYKLGDVLTILSASRCEKVVGYSKEEAGKYEVLMEKHVCNCKKKEETVEPLNHSPISP